jgi:glutaconate CoA-transferase subunit B
VGHWTPFGHLVVNLARQIRPGEVVFTGVNSEPAMLACLLARHAYAYDFDYTYLSVAGGVDPQPDEAPASSSDPGLCARSPAIFANPDFYDLCLRGALDLCFLGCAQVDALGRTNVSTIGPWHEPRVRLPGGGGAVIMLPTARRAVTWRSEHSPRTLVERLDFVTAAGRMAAVVTPLAVFERDPDEAGARLRLASWNPAAPLDEVRARTGFAFDAAGAMPTAPITAAEQQALERLDPAGAFAARHSG